MHRAQLRFEGALVAGGIRIDARDAHRAAVGPAQQPGELLLEPLGAAADRRDVEVAAVRTSARNALGEAAMVAAQAAVELVKNAPRAAMRAAAFPAAVATVQHRRVATAVEEDETLLAALDALLQRGDERRRERRGHAFALRQLVHVDQPNL